MSCICRAVTSLNILIVGILLAAGQSSRFAATNSILGSQKLLAELPNRQGRRVVEASAANLLQAVGRVIAVTHRNEKLMRVLDDCGCQVIVNERALDGMGASIAAGVQASLEASPCVTGWIIALGDMPYVLPETITAVCQKLEEQNRQHHKHSIVIPTYQGKRGHPVGFGQAYEGALRRLQGDAGAKSIIDAAAAENALNVLQLILNDPGVLADIDVASDMR